MNGETSQTKTARCNRVNPVFKGEAASFARCQSSAKLRNTTPVVHLSYSVTAVTFSTPNLGLFARRSTGKSRAASAAKQFCVCAHTKG